MTTNRLPHASWTRTIDAYGRLRIPVALRDRLADGVVLSMPLVLEPYVDVWPARVYDAQLARIMGDIPADDQRRTSFERFILGLTCDGALDREGRVTIPDFLRDHARLKNEVTIRRAGDHLELWQPGT